MNQIDNQLRQCAFVRGFNHAVSQLIRGGLLDISQETFNALEQHAESTAAKEYPCEPVSKRAS